MTGVGMGFPGEGLGRDRALHEVSTARWGCLSARLCPCSGLTCGTCRPGEAPASTAWHTRWEGPARRVGGKLRSLLLFSWLCCLPFLQSTDIQINSILFASWLSIWKITDKGDSPLICRWGCFHLWGTMVMSESTAFTAVIGAGCVWGHLRGPEEPPEVSVGTVVVTGAGGGGRGAWPWVCPSPAQLHVRCEPIVQMRKRRHRELD